MTTRPGVSVRCSLASKTGLPTSHDRYDGVRSKAPKRQRCSYCGGQLVATPAVWAPVEWRRDGRYECPPGVYGSPEAALAACIGSQVVRSFAPREKRSLTACAGSLARATVTNREKKH